MQTVKENQVNELVWPYEVVAWVNPPSGSKSNYIFAYETLANNPNSSQFASFATASLELNNERWRVTPINLVTGSTTNLGEMYVRAGTTYEISFRYGIKPFYTWKEAEPLWEETAGNWSSPFLPTTDNSIIMGSDRMFVSGAVSPKETLYITSNDDAKFTIYQG